MKLWQLPSQLDDLRPPHAWEFELLRRRFLDHLTENGYQYVHPPLVEYATALSNTNSEHELCVVSGLKDEQLAIRADITAQVVRIDANLQKNEVVRYCYAGEVFRTQASALNNQRNPYQIGAELFGDASLQADIESITLALECTKFISCQSLTLDISNTAVLSELCKNHFEVIDILRRRSKPDLQAYAIRNNAPELSDILDYSGNNLTAIAEKMTSCNSNIQAALKQVQDLSQAIKKAFPEIHLYFDFAETQGWGLHSGLSWRLFSKSTLIARGGRYDGIGERFGHSRPATGFSFELNQLIKSK